MEETLGKRIVHNRKRLGLTQDALAEKLGVTAQAVSKWENDQSCPDITILPRLAAIFGITTDSLLGLEAPAKEAEVTAEDAPGLYIDSNDGHWDFRWNSGKRTDIGLGLWIICAGAMLLAANLLGQHVSIWSALWITGLTVFGIFGLCSEFSCLRLGCTLAGGYFLVNELWPRLFVLDKSLFLPILLVLFGLSLLLDAGKQKHGPTFVVTPNAKEKRVQHYQVTEDGFNCLMSFCDHRQNVEMPRFRQGTAEVRFGDLTLDLSTCREFAESSTLSLTCAFGDLTVLVPTSVQVKPSTRTTFAEFAILGHPDPDAARIMHLSADASFGEITIRYI